MMITGVVSTDLDAQILVVLRGPTGREQRFEAVVDTGFNGWVTLPPAAIANLDLPWLYRGRAILADGSEVLTNMYAGTVIWDGAPRRVAVDAVASEPLVGMMLLHGYELAIQVTGGGRVAIQPMA